MKSDTKGKLTLNHSLDVFVVANTANKDTLKQINENLSYEVLVASSTDQDAKNPVGNLDLNRQDLEMIQSYPEVPEGKPLQGGIYQKGCSHLQFKEVKIPTDPIYFIKTKNGSEVQLDHLDGQLTTEQISSFKVSKVEYLQFLCKVNSSIYIVVFENCDQSETVEFLLRRSNANKEEVSANSVLSAFLKRTEMKSGTKMNELVEKSLKLTHLAFLLGKVSSYEGLADKIEEICPEIKEDCFFDFNYMSLLLKATQLRHVAFLRQQENAPQSIESIFDQVRTSRPEQICLGGILGLLRAKFFVDTMKFSDFYDPYMSLFRKYYTIFSQPEGECQKIISKIKEFQGLGLPSASKTKSKRRNRPQKVKASNPAISTVKTTKIPASFYSSVPNQYTQATRVLQKQRQFLSNMKFSSKELRTEIAQILSSCKVPSPVKSEIDITLLELSKYKYNNFVVKFIAVVRILKKYNSKKIQRSANSRILSYLREKYGERSTYIHKFKDNLKEQKNTKHNSNEQQIHDVSEVKKEAILLNVSTVEDKYFELLSEHEIKFGFENFHNRSIEYYKNFLKRQRDNPIQDYFGQNSSSDEEIEENRNTNFDDFSDFYSGSQMQPSKPKTKLKLNKNAEEFKVNNIFFNKAEQIKRQRLEQLNDPEFEFDDARDNKLRERKFRKVVKVPFLPSKPDANKLKEDEVSRIKRENLMYEKFTETHGNNIFLMDFFKALNLISEISAWVSTGNFLIKIAKHKNELQRGLPKMYSSRLVPKHSGLKFEIETRIATVSEKKEILDAFGERLIDQFKALESFDFKVKIKDFLAMLNFNQNGLQSVANLIPNLIPFIISKLDCDSLLELIIVDKLDLIRQKHYEYSQEIKRRKKDKFGFGRSSSSSMFGFGRANQEFDEDDFTEEISFEDFLIKFFIDERTPYMINRDLRSLVSYEIVQKVAHKLFNRLFERISFYARVNLKNISVILGRDVLQVLVSDVYTNFVSKKADTQMVDVEDIIEEAIQNKKVEKKIEIGIFEANFGQLGLNKKNSKRVKSKLSKRKHKKDKEILMNFRKDYLKVLSLPDSNPFKPNEDYFFEFLRYLLPSMNKDPQIVLSIIEALFQRHLGTDVEFRMFDIMLRVTWFQEEILREVLSKYLKRLQRILTRKISSGQSFTKVFFDLLRVEDEKLKIIDEIFKFTQQKSLEDLPIRVKIQDLINISDQNHKIPNFDQIYSTYDAKEAALANNWIDPVQIRILQRFCTYRFIPLRQIQEKYPYLVSIKNAIDSMPETNTYINFIMKTGTYLTQIEKKELAVTSIFRLRQLFRGAVSSVESSPEFDLLLRYTKDQESQYKQKTFELVLLHHKELATMEEKIKNAQYRLNLCKFIDPVTRDASQASLNLFKGLKESTNSLDKTKKLQQYECIVTLDHKELNEETTFPGYTQYVEQLNNLLLTKPVNQRTLAFYKDSYLQIYQKFQKVFLMLPTQLNTDLYNSYVIPLYRPETSIDKVASSLQIDTQRLNSIKDVIEKYELIQKFAKCYNQFKTYTEYFIVKDDMKILPVMASFYSILKCDQTQAKENPVTNVTIEIITTFVTKVLEYPKVDQRDKLKTMLERFTLIVNMADYRDVVQYIKEKSFEDFENIRTEIDEHDVEDFMKLLSLKKYLTQVIDSQNISEFFESFFKLKSSSLEKLNEYLFDVGPKIDQIKEIALRANQSTSNDYENIVEIIKNCQVALYWSKTSQAFQCEVSYNKKGAKLTYRFKEFEELYKKESILKDSEEKEMIKDEDLDEENEEDEEENHNQNPHRRFCDLGDQIFQLLEILNRFKSIGLLDNTFTEIRCTFLNDDSASYLKFSSNDANMVVKFEKSKNHLKELNKQLLQEYEECREQLHKKYQIPSFANLTYFYGQRLYDLSQYMIQRNVITPQLRELFSEIRPNYDPYGDSQSQSFLELDEKGKYDLKNRVENLAKFLESRKDENRDTDAHEPICADRKLCYLLNRDETVDDHKAIPLFRLIHNVIDTHKSPFLNGSQILLCSQHTSEEEIIAFCFRSLTINRQKISFIVNPENLSKQNFNILKENYEKVLSDKNRSRSTNVLIIMTRKNDDYLSVFKESNFFAKYSRKVHKEIKNPNTIAILKMTHVYYSDQAGMGKSTKIDLHAQRQRNQDKIVLFLTGELSYEIINKRIEVLEKRLEDQKFFEGYLHIKLDTMQELEKSSGLVDYFLFQICFFRRIQTQKGCSSLSKIKEIYIEIGNTMGFERLKEKFSTIMLFKDNFHLCPSFNTEDLIVPKERDAKAQIVAFFLNITETKVINFTTEQDFLQPFDEETFRKIMASNFMRGENRTDRDQITYSQYNTWIRICYNLFKEFSKCPDLTPDALTNRQVIRYEFANVIRNFASKLIQFSVKQARDSQRKHQDLKENYGQSSNSEITQVYERFEKMSKWDAKNNLIPFISNGRYMIFHGSDELFKDYESLRCLIEGKKIGILGVSKLQNNSMKSKDYLKIYDYIFGHPTDHLYNRSKKFPNLPENEDNESGVEEGYVLTEENNLKMALMLVKASIGEPIVIMGESGCGKTYFTKFTASCIKEDTIKVITLHAGVSEPELLKFLKESIVQAKEMHRTKPNKKLWILFDEFNTSPLQSIVTEIMQDRVCSIDAEIDEIPKNLVFVACCNPFQMREKKSDLGLIPDTADNRLSHQVYIVLESLLLYVWDFGSLSEFDEKQHIFSIIEAEEIFGKEKTAEKDFLKNVVYNAHKFVREQEKGGVSLRDMKRIIKLVKWAHEYTKLKAEVLGFKKDKDQIIAAVFIAIQICYGLRMNGISGKKANQTVIADLYELIHQKCIDLIVKMHRQKYTSENVLKLLDQIEESFSKELNAHPKLIPQGIALNKPLRENIFTLYACYSTLTPLLICGKPGTSKTLCAQIFSACMKEEFASKITSLQNLPESIELYYGGSQTSTDVGIQRVFDRADKIIENDKKDKEKGNQEKAKRPIILIDEIGLAELSPYRPLKILHPKLEKKNKEYFFLGVSNWALDLSKMNRVVYLARPDMSFEDLRDTFVSITELDARRCQGLMSDFIQTYLVFREWQMKFGNHKNFHGSRDIYSVFKHIKLLVNNTTDLTDEVLISILKESIERNFSGELYKITERNQDISSLVSGKIKRKPEKESEEITENTQKKKVSFKPKKVVKPTKVATSEVKPEANPEASKLDGSSDVKFDGNQLYNNQKELLYISGIPNLYKYSEETKAKIRNMEKFMYENSSQTFMRQLIYISPYLKSLQRDQLMGLYRSTVTMEHVKANLRSSDSRFLLLFTETPLIDSVLIQLLKQEFKNREIIDWRGNQINYDLKKSSSSNSSVAKGLQKATNSGDEQKDENLVKNDKQTVEMLSMMKTYIQTGKIVVMKGIDELYGSLYDLFNQKYIERNGEKWCYLYYGDEKPKAQVHPEFKCIVIIHDDSMSAMNEESNQGLSSSNSDNTQISTLKSGEMEIKQPAPFLNRFEKYRLKMVDVISEAQCENLKTVLEEALRLSEGLESRFVSLNLEMICSIIVSMEDISDIDLINNPFAEGNEAIEESKYFGKLLRLTTSNYLLAQGDKISRPKIEAFKEAHPYDSILSLMKTFDEDYLKLRKSFVFTFSSTFSLERVLKQTETKSAEESRMIKNWVKIDSFELLKRGTADRSKYIEQILGQKKHLLVQFTRKSHLTMIPVLKAVVDNYLGFDQKDFDRKSLAKFSGGGLGSLSLKRFNSKDSSQGQDNNFIPGVLFLIHLNESSTHDLQNTGISFWYEWQNWVIEDITNSNYSNIDKLFLDIQQDGRDLESVWHILDSNSDLRSKVFQKLMMDALITINENIPDLNFESEMSNISMLISSDLNIGQNRLSFIEEISHTILKIDFISNSLRDSGLTQKLFIKCQEEKEYFHYEDKLVLVMPITVKELITKVLVKLQMQLRLFSINNMFNIYKNEIFQQTGINIFNKQLEQINLEIEKISDEGHQLISNADWSNWKADLRKWQLSPSQNLMPLVDYPIFSKFSNSIVNNIMKAKIDDGMGRGYVKEYKELVYLMMSDENEFKDEENVNKFIKLQTEIKDLLSQSLKMLSKRLEKEIKEISDQDDNDIQQIQEHIITDILNEYFRYRSKDLNRIRFTLLISDMVKQFVNCNDFSMVITNLGYVLMVYDDQIQNLELLSQKLSFDSALMGLLSLPEEELSQVKGWKFFELVKKVKNSVMIKLIFDTQEQESVFIEKILEKIEVVSDLEFEKDDGEEVTIVENVNMYRILLNLINLTYKIQGVESDELNLQDKLDINGVLNRSKSAHDPEIYRFFEFTKIIINRIQVNLELFQVKANQSILANLIGSFNQELFRMITRTMEVEGKDEKVIKFFDKLIKLMFTIFNNDTFSSVLNSLFDHSVLHSIINLISSQVYSILDDDITIFSIKNSKPKRFLEIKADKFAEHLKHYLEKEIINDWIVYSQESKNIREGAEQQLLKLSPKSGGLEDDLCKSLCDVYTIRYQSILQALCKEYLSNNSKQTFLNCFDILLGVTDSFNEPNGILHFKRVAYIRAFLNCEFLQNYEKFDRAVQINRHIRDRYMLVAGQLPEAMFNHPNYMIVNYLIKNFDLTLTHGVEDFDSDIKFKNKVEEYDIVRQFLEITNPSKAKNPLVMCSTQHRDLQRKINDRFVANKLNNVTNWISRDIPEVNVGEDQINIVRYIVGIVILNELTRVEEQEDDSSQNNIKDLTAGSVKVGFSKKFVTKDLDLRYYNEFLMNDDFIKKQSPDWCLYIHTLINRHYHHLNRFTQMANFDEYLKIILHFGLVLVSFRQTYVQFDSSGLFQGSIERKYQLAKEYTASGKSYNLLTSSETGQVGLSLKTRFQDEKSISLNLLHPYPQDYRFSALLDKLIFVHETRMKESMYTYAHDIGIYECDCGLIYSLENCGMASVTDKCRKCGKDIGGSGHVHVTRQGHVHYKTVDELKARIRQLYDKHKSKFWFQRTMPFNGDDYKNYDYFEGDKDRVERILTHFFDNAYLLLYPTINIDIKDKIDQIYTNSFKSDPNQETFKTINNTRIQTYEDYYLAHLMFDIEQIMNKCNVSIKDTVRLFNEAIIQMAESLAQKSSISSIIQHTLCGERNLFGNTNLNLGLINSRLDQWSEEETNIKKQEFNFALKKMSLKEIREFFPVHYYNCQLFRNIPIKNLSCMFEDSIKENWIQRDYPYLCHFMNIREVLPVYSRIVLAHLNLVTAINETLGGLYSVEEARVTQLDRILDENFQIKDAYKEFQEVWKTVIPPIKLKHSSMFNIAFMCQRNLDPDDYFKKLTQPELLTLMDVILIESDTNEGIFLLGIIQTLVKWQEEQLNKARALLNRPKCKSKFAMKLQKEDYLEGVGEKSLVEENAFFSLNFNQENMVRFNYHNIEQKLATVLSENKLIPIFEKDTPNCIQFFQFKGGEESSQKWKIVEKVLGRINREDMDIDLRERFEASALPELENIKSYLSLVCLELYKQVIYDDDLQISELTEKYDRFYKIPIFNINQELLREVKLSYLAEIIDIYHIKSVDIKLDEDKKFYTVPLSVQMQKGIIRWCKEMHDRNDEAIGGDPIHVRLQKIIYEIKLEIYKMFIADRPMSSEVGVFENISIECDDEFYGFITAFTDVDEKVKFCQLLSVLHMMEKLKDDYLHEFQQKD